MEMERERKQRLDRRMDIGRDRHREGVMQPCEDKGDGMWQWREGGSREEVKESALC